jgi:hypothetical protein
MPGSEPWMQVTTYKGVWKLPAACSILELWEVLQQGPRGAKAPAGEVMVRVPLDLVLSQSTLAAYGQTRRRQSD